MRRGVIVRTDSSERDLNLEKDDNGMCMAFRGVTFGDDVRAGT